jgi:serine/threonine protein kinase
MQQQSTSVIGSETVGVPPPSEQTTVLLPEAPDLTGQLAPNRLLKGRFLVEAELGRGGMGVVYKALDKVRQESCDPQPYVALKVLNPSLGGNEMLRVALQRECKRCQGLRHPNIIAVYDFDRDGPYVFMTMEFLDGQTLSETIKNRRQGVEVDKAWPWIEAMGDALAFAHRNGIIHSDFKPENVFITLGQEIKVMDFGVARLANRNQGAPPTVIDGGTLGAHTPSYASVEMIRGEPTDPADDLFAFACTVYELLSGSHPYAYLSSLQAKALDMRPKRLPGLDWRQWRALQRALALDRKTRGSSIPEFLKEFRPYPPTPRWVYGAVGAGVLGIVALLNHYQPWVPAQTQTVSPPPKSSPKPPVASQTAPSQGTSGQQVPSQAAPAQGTTPAQTSPAQAAPAQGTTPAQTSPTQAATGQGTTPAQTSPAQAATGQGTTPAQTSPAQAATGQGTTPAQDSTPQATPDRVVLTSPQISEEIIQQLGQIRSIDNRMALGVGVDKPRFHIGDRIQLRFAVAEPAHVYVVTVDPANQAALIYPNPYQEDQAARTNEIYPIPPFNSSDFILRISKPVGRHRIFAIASKEELADVAELVRSGKHDLGNIPNVSSAEITIDVLP